MKFTVQRYIKGTQDRGSILGAVDDILQILDDNAMNLQSISGSRFVGPFLNTVQLWEKSLSLIGEVIAVSNIIAFIMLCTLLSSLIKRAVKCRRHYQPLRAFFFYQTNYTKLLVIIKCSTSLVFV